MLISSQMFDRILGNATQPAAHDDRKAAVLPVGCRRAPERRTATRIALGQRISICRDRGTKAGVWDTVLMQDISLNGIGFMCHEPMTTGDTFVLKVADKDGQFIRIRCAIRRCERGGIGGVAYHFGATFEQVIQLKSLQLNDDDGELTPWSEQSHDQQCEALATTGGVATAVVPTTTTRSKFSFLKALDPSTWLRKDDDYSSLR